MKRQRTATTAGFTLIELLVAVSILGIVTAGLYGTFSRTVDAQSRARGRALSLSLSRAVVDWLSTDLHGAYDTGTFGDRIPRFFANGTPVASSLYEQAVVLDLTALTTRTTTPLSGLLPRTSGPDDRGDQMRVVYRVERDEDESLPADTFSLIRYELRPPRHGVFDHGSRAVIASGLEKLTLRFWDGRRWVESWDSEAPGPQTSSVPRMVEATISLPLKNAPSMNLTTAIYLGAGAAG